MAHRLTADERIDRVSYDFTDDFVYEVTQHHRVHLSRMEYKRGAGQPPTEREDARDDSPGLIGLLTHYPKLWNRSMLPTSYFVLDWWLQQPSPVAPHFTNYEMFDIGIKYINTFANLLLPLEISMNGALSGRGQALRSHCSDMYGALALVVHCIAYGFGTSQVGYESLHEKSTNPRLREQHYCMVMPLLVFAVRYMNHHGEFRVKAVLKKNITSWMKTLRSRMKQFGIWSRDALILRLHNVTELDRDSWIGGPRLEIARLVSLLGPGPWDVHRTRGICTGLERRLVQDSTDIDEHNGITHRHTAGHGWT